MATWVPGQTAAATDKASVTVAGEPTVDRVGPSLPAEVTRNRPRFAASRTATASGSSPSAKKAGPPKLMLAT